MGNIGAPGFGHQILGFVDFPSTKAKSSRLSLCRSSGTRSRWQGWDGEDPSSIMSRAHENNDGVGVFDVKHSCSVSATLKSFSRRHSRSGNPSADRANLELNQTLQDPSGHFDTFHPKWWLSTAWQQEPYDTLAFAASDPVRGVLEYFRGGHLSNPGCMREGGERGNMKR